VIELLVVDELFGGDVIATAGGVVSGGAETVTFSVSEQFPLPLVCGDVTVTLALPIVLYVTVTDELPIVLVVLES
jgi:hypothetical protein